MTKKSRHTGVREGLVNDPDILAKLREFRARVDRMESQRERLTKNYPNHWAALYGGDFVVAESLEDLLEKLEDQGVPTHETVIRFLDPETGTHDPLPPVIRGRFDHYRRPYVLGRLILPRWNIQGEVDFLVDTGADSTIISPI